MHVPRDRVPGLATRSETWGTPALLFMPLVLSALALIEVEQFEQIADSRAIDWHVWVAPSLRIGKVVAATLSQRLESPVPFDELQYGDVVRVVVSDVACFCVRRNHDERNARAVAKVVEWLHVAGVVVTAAFVHGDEDCSARPQFGIALHGVDDFLYEAFEQVDLGGSGMSIHPAAGLGVRDRGQGSILNIGVEVRRVLKMGGAHRGVGHD